MITWTIVDPDACRHMSSQAQYRLIPEHETQPRIPLEASPINGMPSGVALTILDQNPFAKSLSRDNFPDIPENSSHMVDNDKERGGLRWLREGLPRILLYWCVRKLHIMYDRLILSYFHMHLCLSLWRFAVSMFPSKKMFLFVLFCFSLNQIPVTLIPWFLAWLGPHNDHTKIDAWYDHRNV